MTRIDVHPIDPPVGKSRLGEHYRFDIYDGAELLVTSASLRAGRADVIADARRLVTALRNAVDIVVDGKKQTGFRTTKGQWGK